MKIELKKFGTTLISRQAGREAMAAFLPSLKDVSEQEIIEVDFDGVITFSPSWGDEFLTPLLQKYQKRLLLKNTKNSSVQATLELLQKIQNKKFRVISQ